MSKPRLIKLIQILLLIIMMIASSMYAIAWSYQQKSDKDFEFGISFSQAYAEELNLDWKEAYEANLRDLGVKKVRLMSYWTFIENERDNPYFNDLDWQFEKSQEYNAKISLALGQRQPRWPECHVPDWAKQLDTVEYETEILEFIEQVVNRYKDHPALENFQLENEAANRNFGDCEELNRELLQKEYDLIRSLTDKDIVINASNQSGIPLREPVGDKVGFSIYKRAHFDAIGQTWSWSFNYVPSWWHSFRAGLVEGIHKDTSSFIHELQAEPWGPKATVDLSTQEQFNTMDPEKLIEIVEFAKTMGMNEIYLWGAEWWYWRLTEFNDPSLWNTAKQIIKENYAS